MFSEQKELIKFAKGFIQERLESLDRDVRNCLAAEPPAPFPALLYCFSTIDLLGALCAGNAKKNASTTTQSAEYMLRFMGYTEEQVRLLQDLFRHKIVHLAQPKAVIEDESRRIYWAIWHDNAEEHLKLVEAPQGTKVQITPSWEIPCDHKFTISISHLVRDIRSSVERSGGYLASLETTPDLQERFNNAITQIYDPTVGVPKS